MISINRNVFTKEGLKYLEHEVYPALISSAKEALVVLNEQAVAKEEKMGSKYLSFDKKIMKSIAHKTDQCVNNEKMDSSALNHELEETVMSAIGLSYFYRILGKKKHYFCEKREKNANICIWDRLLNTIVEFRKTGTLPDMHGGYQEIFEKQRDFQKYIDHGMLYRIKVYQYHELERTGIRSAKIIMDYASLLLEKNKVAIISLRHNRYAKWFYVPLLVYDGDREKGNPYEIFQRKSQTAEEDEKLMGQMETWADGILGQLGDLGTVQTLHEEYGANSDVQHILYYMLGNISTVALYTNDSAEWDIRINVLSAEGSESIFYNKNMRHLILKKVGRLYERFHAKRFVTTTWRGYECITLNEMPSSVFIVNGAYIARQQTERMLLPILGDNNEKLLNVKNEQFFKEYDKQRENYEELKTICNELLGFYPKFEEAMGMDKKEAESVEGMIGAYLELDPFWRASVGNRTRKGQSYWRELIRHIKSRLAESEKNSEAEEIDFDQLKEDQPDRSEFQKMLVENYFESVGLRLEGGPRLQSDMKEKYWKWFLNAVRFIRQKSNADIRKQILEDDEMKKFKRSLWEGSSTETDDVQKNLISYVMEKSQEDLSEKQVRRCYEKLMDDMIESVIQNQIVQTSKDNSYIEMLIRD